MNLLVYSFKSEFVIIVQFTKLRHQPLFVKEMPDISETNII